MNIIKNNSIPVQKYNLFTLHVVLFLKYSLWIIFINLIKLKFLSITIINLSNFKNINEEITKCLKLEVVFEKKK